MTRSGSAPVRGTRAAARRRSAIGARRARVAGTRRQAATTWLPLLVSLAAWPCAQPAAGQPVSAREQPIPAWASAALRSPEFADAYSLSTRLRPAHREADFDGDGRLDVAVLVARRATGSQGIAFLRAGSPQPVVVGAGHPLGNGGDDFSWMDAWSVYPKAGVPRGAGEAAPPRLRGDALLVEKLEAASAIVYWDGAAYRWYQQGD